MEPSPHPVSASCLIFTSLYPGLDCKLMGRNMAAAWKARARLPMHQFNKLTEKKPPKINNNK